ncbi:MAG: hypothetical protein IJZ38_12965 [Bacteroides sp.]|nr:hypothetical protein [Bacteroides sp.]
MTQFDSNRKIITVTGDEAQLVHAAEMVEMNAERRARSEAPGGTKVPMIFYETEQEKAIISKFNQLRESYRMAYGLSVPPLLVPAVPYSVVQPQKQIPDAYVRRAFTDLELAKELLQRVILRRKGETIHLFNGTYFKRLSVDKLHTLILQELRDELSINGSSKQIKSVAAAIMAEPSIEVTETMDTPSGLCLMNGVLDIATFTLYEHSPRCFFTWKMTVSWQGPQACPEFDRFLETVTGGDQVLLQRFWEVIGYLLVPGDNLAKRFIVLIGHGDTGKSVLGELIRFFFEPDAVGGVDIFKMGERFALSTLVHRPINVSMDLSNSSLTEQAISVIKQITGRDLVQVEEKYKAPYFTRINCKLVFGTNHALRIGSQDYAFVRRILYLPFNYVIPVERQDHYLINKLVAERPGILYKALIAYRALVARGYVFAGDDVYDMAHAFQPAEQVVDQRETIEEFICQHCAEAEGNFVTTDDLHKSYLRFCQELGREGIQNKQEFSTKFNASINGFPNVTRTKKRVEGVPCNGYMGLILK